MQRRRRCRRYFVARTSILLLTLFSTISSTLLIRKYFLNSYGEQQNEIKQIFLIDENDLEDAKIKPTKDIYILYEEHLNKNNPLFRFTLGATHN